MLRWRALLLLHVFFTDAEATFGNPPASEPNFFSWRVTTFGGSFVPFGLTTAEGIGLNSILLDVIFAYGELVEVFYEDVFDIYFLVIDGDNPNGALTGTLTG